MTTRSMRLSRSIVGQAEADAVAHVLLDDGYLGMGLEVKQFEEDIANYLGVSPQKVVTVNTGTAALHLAVEAVCPPQSEVLVPSLTFVASFQAIGAARCIPVPCEVYAQSVTIDLGDAAKRITERTKAIMPVHYASNPWHLDAVYTFADKHNLRVIEDAAHAFGCTYKGRKIGSFGDMVCFSFDGIKNITCGEGGCIICHDPAAAQLCSDARLLSVKNDAAKRFSGARSWDFETDRQGWRYHMSNIMAAIGRTQLTQLDSFFAPARRQFAQRYRERLGTLQGITLLEQDAASVIIPHIFPVRILHGRQEAVKAALAAEGIPTGVHYKPNHLLQLYGGGSVRLPVTEQLYSELITLPLHPGLLMEDIDAVCDALQTALQ